MAPQCTCFLDQVKEDYLTLLTSRWAALLPRLAKQTQRMQQANDLSDNKKATAMELQESFALAEQLLEQEHQLYRVGRSLVEEEAVDGARLSHLERFTNGFLTEMTMKEVMIADWRATVETIPSDTLRVYAHAMLSHPHVSPADVDHLLVLMKQ